jgi:hypothetical protein
MLWENDMAYTFGNDSNKSKTVEHCVMESLIICTFIKYYYNDQSRNMRQVG